MIDNHLMGGGSLTAKLRCDPGITQTPKPAYFDEKKMLILDL